MMLVGEHTGSQTNGLVIGLNWISQINDLLVEVLTKLRQFIFIC